MNTVPKRMIISTKDVQRITGKSARSSRRILQQVRQKNGKGYKALVSVEEFCQYMGMRVEEVRSFLL